MTSWMKGLLILLIFIKPCFSDINNDMKTFFNKLGVVGNASVGGAYKDQSAGYYAGGSLFARNRVYNSELVHLQLPGYKAGCGGIDMHFGALSYISSEKLVGMLRSIGSSVASYALMLALETMSPQVKNIVSELNDLAQKINMSNVNSCKVAATALGALLPQSDAAQHHLCNMIGNDSAYGGFSDYAAANQGCGVGGQRRAVLRAGQNDPKFAKMLGGEFNLAWKALQENSFLRADEKLAYLFMTLSGTIVSREQGDGFEIQTKPSMASHETLLTALLRGGQAAAYVCDDPKKGCLTVSLKNITIAVQDSFLAQIEKILLSLQHKIFNDEALSVEEKSFLESTKLPFYKILNVLTAYRQDEAPLMIRDYAELAAIDVLYHYLTQILDIMEESLSHIKAVQIDASSIKRFEAALRIAKNRIHQKRMGDFKAIEQVLAFVKKTEMLEKSLLAKLGMVGMGDL